MKNSAWSPSESLVGSQEKEKMRKAAARGSKYLKKSSLWLSPPRSPPGVSEAWGGGLLGPWGYLEGIWPAVLKRTPTCLASPRVSLASGSGGAWGSSTGTLSVILDLGHIRCFGAWEGTGLFPAALEPVGSSPSHSLHLGAVSPGETQQLGGLHQVPFPGVSVKFTIHLGWD